MQEYDDAVLQCFLKHQLQLFPEAVTETAEEAEEFFEEEGIDIATSGTAIS